MHVLFIKLQVAATPGLQCRYYHCATAFAVTPNLVEVVIFGGAFEPPKHQQRDKDIRPLAKTDELKFGKVIAKHDFEGLSS